VLLLHADIEDRLLTPGRAVYSALNVIGSYHDSVLLRTVTTLPPSLRPAPSSHLRYTKYYLTHSRSYHYLARLLQLVTQLELLIEMGLTKRRGRRAGEDSTVVLEGIKAILRLAIFKTTNGRSVLQPPVPEREVDPSVLDLHKPHVVGDPPNARISFEGEGESWKGPRTGVDRPTLKSMREDAGEGGINAWLKSRVLTIENAKRPKDLVQKTKGVAKVAEMIWILRPLVYGPSPFLCASKVPY
jgi:peroxin-16